MTTKKPDESFSHLADTPDTVQHTIGTRLHGSDEQEPHEVRGSL